MSAETQIRPRERSGAAGYPGELALFVAGEWVSGGGRETIPVVNPADERILGRLPLAAAADLDAALAGADRAYPAWRALAPDARGRILRRAAELLRDRTEALATVATLEEGKPLAETRIEVAMAAGTLEWYAEEGRRAYGRVLVQRAPGTRMTVVREPVGPVAAFAPWNFPLANPARKIGAALAAGCPCILKPAEETPASALAVVRALEDAGLPAGVLSVVFGVPAEVSGHLLASPVIRKVSFTGSVPVGKQLVKLAADTMKRTTMELGGHAPVIVLDDVDIDAVLDQAVAAKYRNAGQVCVSPTRFYVHESVYERFAAGFAQRTRALAVGDGLAAGTQMGPLAHDRRPAAVESIVADATARGARVLAGGAPIGGPGYFWEPTVLVDAPRDARVLNEEPFGPLAVIAPIADLDEAIAEANRLPYGLAAYAFSHQARAVRELGERLEAGMVGLNTFAISVPESPFGGVKESGHGSEEGIEGLEACLITKFVNEG